MLPFRKSLLSNYFKSLLQNVFSEKSFLFSLYYEYSLYKTIFLTEKQDQCNEYF